MWYNKRPISLFGLSKTIKGDIWCATFDPSYYAEANNLLHYVCGVCIDLCHRQMFDLSLRYSNNRRLDERSCWSECHECDQWLSHFGVQVVKEDPYTGTKVLATTAFLTFVALDENKKPTAAPPILPETEEEKRRFKNARLRVRARKELLKKIS